MTRDNDGVVNASTGEPGGNIEPADVIKCRECGGMVRRVNKQHLASDRCRYTHPEKVRVNRDARDDLLRKNHPATVDEYKEKFPGAPIMSPREKTQLSVNNRDEEVSQRRKEMIRRKWSGEDMERIYDSLQEKYDVSRSSLRRDWAERGDWIGPVFGMDDAEAVVMESLAQKKGLRQRLMRAARRAEDQNELGEAVRALKAADSNIDDTIEHLRKLGKVAQAEKKQAITVEGSVEHDHDHVHQKEETGTRLDEETLQALDEITGGDDEDIIDAEYKKMDPPNVAENESDG